MKWLNQKIGTLVVMLLLITSPCALLAKAKELPEPTQKAKAEKTPAKPSTPAQQAQPVNIEAAPVNLRPMFVKGRTSHYSIWQQREQEVSLQMAGQERHGTTLVVLQGQVTWTVADVRDDGSATCIMTNDHFLLTITPPDGKIQIYDTNKSSGDNEAIFQRLKALTNAPITVEMSADGKALSVKGEDVVKQRLGEKFAATAPKAEDFLENATDLAVLPLAPAKLMVGGQWNDAFDWSHEVGRIRMKVQFQLANVELIAGIPIATINETAEPVIVPDYSKIPEGGPKVNIQQIQGSYQSQVLFDLQRHDLAGSNTIRQTGLRITISLPQNRTIIRLVNEKLQVQLLRIAEK